MTRGQDRFEQSGGVGRHRIKAGVQVSQGEGDVRVQADFQAVIRADRRRDQADPGGTTGQDHPGLQEGTADHRAPGHENPFENIFQVDTVIEGCLDRGEFVHAAPDVNVIRAVDGDLGDGVVAQVIIQGAERKQVAIGFVDEGAAVALGNGHRFDAQHVIQHIDQYFAALFGRIEIEQNVGAVGGFFLELALDTLAQRLDREAGAA